MIKVKTSIHPFGNECLSRSIGVTTIVNIKDNNGKADYAYRHDVDENIVHKSGDVKGHNRKEGYEKLLYLVFKDIYEKEKNRKKSLRQQLMAKKRK